MKLNDIFVALSTVDSWSQVSCLGSMHYLVSAQAIREAVRLVPDMPTAETMEAFLNEERNMKLDRAHLGKDQDGKLVHINEREAVMTTPGNYNEQRESLSALLYLRAQIDDALTEATTSINTADRPRDFASVLTFMKQQKAPDKVRFARQYVAWLKSGAKNFGVTQVQYVENEMRRAVRSAAEFEAKGELAVQFVEGLDALEGPINEELMDTLTTRCIDKLQERLVKISISTTWRSKTSELADAHADMMFIQEAIKQLGGTIPDEAPIPRDEPEVEVVVMTKTDPRAPSNVTITRH